MRYDELAHWGILGMKWGVRRYQNEDGSLTPLGREHYNVGPARKTWDRLGKNVGVAARATGRGALKVGKAVGKEALVVGKNVARKHVPKIFMSDEQLQASIARAEAEKRFYQAKKEASRLKVSKGREVAGKILTSGVEELGRRAFGKIGDKIFDRDRIDYQYLLSHPDEITDTETARKVKDYREAMKIIRGEDNLKSKQDRLNYERNLYNFNKLKEADAKAARAEAKKKEQTRVVNRNRKIGVGKKSNYGWGSTRPSYFINTGSYEKGKSVISNNIYRWEDDYLSMFN